MFPLFQLHIAAANGYLRVVEYLLDQNVSTDVRDSDDWQPVHAAACWGHVCIESFLSHSTFYKISCCHKSFNKCRLISRMCFLPLINVNGSIILSIMSCKYLYFIHS